MIVAQRLRKGSVNSARGAQRLVRDALKTVGGLAAAKRSDRPPARALLRADSAFYGHAVVGAAVKARAEVSVTVRLDAKVKAAIAAIHEDAWTTIQYTDAVFDEQTGQWISRAEVAEIDFTAFTSKPKAAHVTGRLVVRRIPDFNAQPGQGTLFEQWRHHAFFTTTPHEVADTIAVDKTHRQHAVIEQVHADLKDSALAHLPSGEFNANAAWLVLAVMAFNLARTAGALSGPKFARATTATIRRKLINVPARIATSARRVTLHLPKDWPWERAWVQLFSAVNAPPQPAAA